MNDLTDKHYFRDDTFARIAYEAGFREVHFQNAEPAAFYDTWMSHFMDVYVITHQPLRYRAMQIFQSLKEYLGPSLPHLVSHFKYIALQK